MYCSQCVVINLQHCAKPGACIQQLQSSASLWVIIPARFDVYLRPYQRRLLWSWGEVYNKSSK